LSAQRTGVQLRAPEGALCATDKPVCCNALLARPSENDINAGENRRKARPRNLTNALLKDLPVERDYLRYVCNGWLGEAGVARRQENIAGGLGPLDLRSEGHTDNGSKRATIQRVTLNDENGSTKARSRPNRITEISPPNFTLSNHHSEPRRSLRAAR
jgi:hypothetical protein